MASVAVRMGTTSLSSGTVMTSSRFIIHASYNPSLLHNDLAIITLPNSVVESSNYTFYLILLVL